MTNAGTKESATRIFALLAVFQRKNRFTASSSGTDLTLLESHLLVEVDGDPGAPVNRLVTSLGVSGSLVSRALRSLSGRGLLAVATAKEDARQRLVRLTAEGSAVSNLLDRNANRLLETFTAAFTGSEIGELAASLRGLADGMAAPATCQRAIDHPIRPGLRRVARSLGLLADRQLDLPISSSQWQVLLATSEENGSATVSAIAERLQIHQSTVSRIVSQLVNQGVVSQRAGRHDRRVSKLSVSRRGAKLLDEGRTMGAAKIAGALDGLSSKKISRTLMLLEKLVYAGSAPDLMVLENGMQVRRVRGEDELRSARAFLVERLVQTGRHEELGDRLIPPEDTTFSLIQGREHLALCSFSGSARGAPVLEHLAGAERALSSWYYAAFIRLCFRTILGTSRERTLRLATPGRYVPPSYRLEWFPGAEEGVLKLEAVPFP